MNYIFESTTLYLPRRSRSGPALFWP